MKNLVINSEHSVQVVAEEENYQTGTNIDSGAPSLSDKHAQTCESSRYTAQTEKFLR